MTDWLSGYRGSESSIASQLRAGATANTSCCAPACSRSRRGSCLDRRLYAALSDRSRTAFLRWPPCSAAAMRRRVVALILSVPLARLRGVFQAIATVAFVSDRLSLALYADRSDRRRAMASTVSRGWSARVLLAAHRRGRLRPVVLGRARVGHAFDAIRQDETVAVIVSASPWSPSGAGVCALSGAIAGVTGALMACHIPQRRAGGIRFRYARGGARLRRIRRPALGGGAARRCHALDAAARDRTSVRR